MFLKRKPSALLFLLILLSPSFTLLHAEGIDAAVSSNNSSSLLELTEKEKLFVVTNPVLHVVSEPAWPPFEYYNTSLDVPQYSGINISILKRIGSILGIDIQFIPTDNYYTSMKSIIR